MMSISKVEDDYQASLKFEEKLAKKQSQRNRGGNSSRGKGTNREKFQKPKPEASKQHSHPEKGESSKEGQHGGRSSFSRGRGRARGGEVRCYACGKIGHMSWECPKRKKEGGCKKHIVEAQKHVEAEAVEGGKNLMMRKILLKPEKEVEELVQRTSLFRTACKTKYIFCKVIIHSGRTNNLVSTKMVEKLELKTIAHPNPYKVSCLQKGHQVMVSQQCQVEFKIGGYRDEILCDVIPMDVCHILLGRPWKFDIKVIHDGRKNNYTLEKNGRTDMLLPIEDKEQKREDSSSILLMSGKELLNEVKEEEMQFVVVRKPRVILTNTSVEDFPEEIQELLENFVGIIVAKLPHSLPPIRSISHHIDFIPGAILPKKSAYRLTPRENEEVKNHVQELLDKGLVRESLIPCVVPTILIPKKDGG
jgi:hypothetical protein